MKRRGHYSGGDTSLSAVVPTHNEEELMSSLVDEVHDYVEEVVIVDSSDDNTVSVTRDACKEYDIEFTLVEVSERDVLTSGMDVIRNMGADAASGTWIMPLDADFELDVEYDGFFDEGYYHTTYFARTVNPNGIVSDSPIVYDNDEDKLSFKGMVGERLMSNNGIPSDEWASTASAPVTIHKKRPSIFDSNAIHGSEQSHNTHVADKKTVHRRKKFHYMLREGMHRTVQSEYIGSNYHDYFDINKLIVTEDWAEISEEMHLPRSSHNNVEDIEQRDPLPWWDLRSGDPVMDYQDHTLTSYIKKKLAEKFGNRETGAR